MAVETRTFIIQIHDSSFLPTPYTVGPTAYDWTIFAMLHILNLMFDKEITHLFSFTTIIYS